MEQSQYTSQKIRFLLVEKNGYQVFEQQVEMFQLVVQKIALMKRCWVNKFLCTVKAK